MVECDMPKDIMKHKSKFIGPFTAREIVFGGAGAALGILVYLALPSSMGNELCMGLSILASMPFFLFGFVKIYNEPFERMLYIIIHDNFICPQTRLYEYRYEMDKPAAKGQKEKKIKPSRKYKPL